ncbi:MAG: hypothetical protein QME81_06755 [bacterium]|nr:hypothetical protein [bacterium]
MRRTSKRESKREENLSKAIYDIGKLSFAVLVIGQFVSPHLFNKPVFIGGTIFTVLAFLIAYLIDK